MFILRSCVFGNKSTCSLSGGAEGLATVLRDGSVHLQLAWGEPCGGTGTDTFTLVSPDELHAVSTLKYDRAMEGCAGYGVSVN